MSFVNFKNKRDVVNVEYIKCYHCNKYGHYAWDCQNKLSKKIIQEIKQKPNNREIESFFKKILERKRIPSQFLNMIPQTLKMLKLLKKLNNSKSFDKNLNLQNKIEILLNKKDFEFFNNIKEKENEKINPITTEEKIDLIFNKIIIKNEESNNKLSAQWKKMDEERNDYARKFYLDFKKMSVNNHTRINKNNKNEDFKKISVKNYTCNKKNKNVEEIKNKFKELRNKKKKMKEELKKIKGEESKKSGHLTSYSKEMKKIMNYSTGIKQKGKSK